MSSLRLSIRARQLFRRSVAFALSVLAPFAAPAHHSYSMFDFKTPRTLSGTVKEFQWTNPHCFIGLEVSADHGASLRYAIETQSPSVLTRIGWKFNTIKAGQQVTIVLFPLRDGRHGGALYSLQLPDGQTLKSVFTEEYLKSGKVSSGP